MLETPSGNYRIPKCSYPKLQKSKSSSEKNQTNRIKTRSSERWIGKETEEIRTTTEELGVHRRATIPGSGQRERAWH